MSEVRPIDANRLSALITEQKVKETGAQSKAYNRALMVCKSIARNPDAAPTLDYAPVVHAQWIACGSADPMEELYYCSKCRRHTYCDRKSDVSKAYPYCHCGAKMDENKKENEHE